MLHSSVIVDPAVNPLVKALTNGLSTRFKPMFDYDCYHVATMLIPKFKLRYLPECNKPVKKLVLIQAVSALDREKQSVLPEVEATPTQPQPGLQRDIEGTESDDLFALSLKRPQCLQQALKMLWMKLIAICRMLM